MIAPAAKSWQPQYIERALIIRDFSMKTVEVVDSKELNVKIGTTVARIASLRAVINAIITEIEGQEIEA